MKHVGIICEFNPFHKGHAYLIEKVKEKFPNKGIVCVMSGNFVQRGSFAISEKYSRAKCAVLSGADLVLELPFPFSCLSAESFARSAVEILSRSGLCDTLAFGVEQGDKEQLLSIGSRLSSSEFKEELESYMKENKGVGYPAAREAVYTARYGNEPLLSLPNASLALEYLMSLSAFSSPLTPFPVKRVGQTVTEQEVKGAYPSATALRKIIGEGGDISPYVPEQTLAEMEKEREEGRFPVSPEKLWHTFLYLLKTTPRRELVSYYGFSALCDRAVRFAGESDSLESLVEKMKNRSFTDSRIRRGLVALLCKIPRHAEKESPLYTQVLAANKKGREILSQIRDKSEISVFTKPSHALRSSDRSVRRQASAAFLADEIYAMAMPKKQEDGFFLKQSPTIF
jgi:cytidyltransferase-like protein